MSYRALEREFDLDSETLADLANELIDVRRVASDENGRILVWTDSSNLGDESSPVAHEPSDVMPVSAPVSRAGERRQITVMFCDLVGSTKLSDTLAPEDLLEVMADYQRVAGAIVERYEYSKAG